jgi:transcriptional regulator GlxA family with amidase domain
VPSGAGSLDADLKNIRVITWLQKTAREAKFITSHCEGAFVLGQAGLLDNKNATTFPVDTETLQKQYPTCRVQTGQRLVVDGNVITSPGGLASYEASLYVVEQLFGKEQALSIALRRHSPLAPAILPPHSPPNNAAVSISVETTGCIICPCFVSR